MANCKIKVITNCSLIAVLLRPYTVKANIDVVGQVLEFSGAGWFCRSGLSCDRVNNGTYGSPL